MKINLSLYLLRESDPGLAPGQPAFLDLVPPEERQKAEVTDSPEVFEAAYMSSGITLFKNHDLVRLIVRNGSDVQVEHLGSAEVGQIATGFQATHIYRIICPEGVFELKVRTIAAESRTGGELKWRIPIDPVPNMTMKAEKISAYGRLVAELEQEGIAYARLWMFHTAIGHSLLSQLATTPREHREPIEKALERAMFLGGAPAVQLPLQPGFLPSDRARTASALATMPVERLAFEDLLRSGFFRLNAKGDPLPDEKIARLRSLWVSPRIQPVGATRQAQNSQMPSDSSTISITSTSINVYMPAELTLEAPAQFSPSVVAVVCSDPALLAAVTAIRERGATYTDPTFSIKSLPPRDWRIAWLRTEMESATMAVGPGAPMPPPR